MARSAADRQAEFRADLRLGAFDLLMGLQPETLPYVPRARTGHATRFREPPSTAATAIIVAWQSALIIE
jgi:hypothetical protein